MKTPRSDYKKTIVPLAIIGVLAAVLSIASFQYSQAAVTTVSEIAREDIRNNAEIQARNLSTMFSTRLDAVDSNLQLLSSSALRNQDEPEILVDVAQSSTDYLTRFYVLIDQEGTIVAASGQSDYLDYLRAGDQAYFAVPQETLLPHVSDLVEIPDAPRNPVMFVSYPIIDPFQPLLPEGRSAFRGVVVAAVDLNFASQFAERSTASTRINSVEVLDNDGTVLYSRNESLVGRNILADELPWSVPDGERGALINFVASAVDGNTLTGEFTINGVESTVISEPVVVNGQHLWTVYVTAPHSLSADIEDLFNQQSFFSSLSLVAIASVTVGIGLIIVSWNKKLAQTIDERTLELRKANESLAESNARLLSLNEQLAANEKLQQEFINIASHEMKTPAQAILFHSDLLKMHSPDVSESVDAIKRNAERLQRLTNNILDVTRIESQNLKLNKEMLNLRDLVSEVVKEYHDLLKNKNNHRGQIDIVLQADDVIVTADKIRITQVLSNLLANAIEFTNEGKILVSCERENDQAMVRVIDAGSGIDQEIMPRLFTKFATKSDKGTGLGLFVSRNIIEAHGGRIWAENNSNGKGATFIFKLPSVIVD